MDYYYPIESLSGLILRVGLAALLTLLFGVYTIGPTECGVLTTFGRAQRTPVATAIVKQLSNLRLEVVLENRDALSRNVREEVSPTSSQWGFSLGSTCIRKVAFRDKGMIAEIQRKVVNRLRQVTAAMRQAGDNEVAIIHSEADRQAARRLGQAQAVRPQVVGRALAEIQRVPEVAEALFALLDVQATLRSQGKLTLASGDTTGLLLNS